MYDTCLRTELIAMCWQCLEAVLERLDILVRLETLGIREALEPQVPAICSL